MPRRKLEVITREEFDRRLDARNERMRLELQEKEAELMRLEQLLTQFETMLNEMEAQPRPEEETSSYPGILRKRLQELALKTAEVAASL